MTMMEARRIAPIENGHHHDESAATAIVTAGAAMTQTRGAFTTALQVQKPRNLKDVLRRVLEEADMAGEDCYYGWGTGDAKVEGPSVDVALLVARNYGNCAIEQLPIVET